MLVVYIALMVAGLVGIIVCQKKQKTNPNAQAVAFLFLIVILVGAGGMLYEFGIFGGDREMDRIMSNEIAFSEARAKVLAGYVGKTWNGQTAVIITEPQTEENKISKASIKALEDGLKAAGINVTATEALNLPTSNGDEPVPMETALTAKVYNDIFNKYKDVNIFVITSQLPYEAKELAGMNCWNFDGKKARVVLVNGEIYNLKPAIKKGIIGAAIAMKSGPNAYDPEKAAPRDVQAAFDTRFILVTPDKVDEIAKANSDLFAK